MSKSSTPKSSKPEAVTSNDAEVIVKQMHMHIGVDLIGSRTSLASMRGTKLILHPLGVLAVNGLGRKILIPFSNIKGMELA